MHYSLNLNNFRKIALNKYDQDFIFIVGDKKYETSRVIADMLSPIINQYHYSDESINEFTITVPDQNDEYFEEFLKLCQTEEDEIDEKHAKCYSNYFLQLGNFEEFIKLNPVYYEDLTITNVLDLLKIYIEAITKFSTSTILTFKNEANLSKLIDFASEHFYEIEHSQIKTINTAIFEEIIKNCHLQIESEDSLLDILIEKYKENSNNSYLFEYIEFCNLKEETIKKFIDQFSIEFLTEGT